MGEELAAAEALKSELRGAIAAGRIVPYFQPIVRLSDGATAGFEVLARWEHPAKGVLPPAAFLDLVEQAGLSAAMFASVLAQACAATRDWPGAPALSVNLSPREMQSEALPDEMAAILRDQRFPGARIEVEVTENALIHDSRIVRGVVDRLRAQGMAIALDDFGTGYSSLYHLRELPFDKVKVDKAFVRPPGADPAGARYAAAIVGFCRALGFATTAEGIEDAETAAFLRELGCSFGQGYWFGRPMPAQAARAFAAGEAPTRVPAQAAE
jgi:EAL domain-containing protein (putative c-di-GMP-specific phosphodiesterase class I)